MDKIVVKGLVVVLSFFIIWWSLSKIDYLAHIGWENLADDIEEDMGDLIWETISKTETESTHDSLKFHINDMAKKLCESNNIPFEKLKVHVIEKDEVNAFAMPNHHMVIYTGLVKESSSPEALFGVMAHELAHMELNHVMKKLSKEIGLSVLLSMTTGGKGAQVQEVLKLLSSSAYDRSLETEADQKAVDYLLKAGVDPKPFADFLYQLSFQNPLHEHFYWISTHPESKARSKDLINYIEKKNQKTDFLPLMSSETWEYIQK
jgi:predicted Zn-dependent protease